jgi:HAD superfamily hydrolase (TIGR01490 family)
MIKRPFAAFDIDGTVIRWQLYHALADEMVRREMLDPLVFKNVRDARMTWKRRTNPDSFLQYEHALVAMVDAALPNITLDDFTAACRAVMEEYRDQVYTYTRDLLQQLKRENYLLFAVSASQQQIVGMFAEYYGFDDYSGSQYEVIDGAFTGKKTLLLQRDNKVKELTALATKHNADWQGSIAVGDSESDIPMLSSVMQPIAFNPTEALFNHARGADWQIVIERKNMVYRLESKNGSYILAQTNVG